MTPELLTVLLPVQLCSGVALALALMLMTPVAALLSTAPSRMVMLALLPAMSIVPSLFHVLVVSHTPPAPTVLGPTVFRVPEPVKVPAPEAPDMASVWPRGTVTLSVALKSLLPKLRPALKLWAFPVFRFSVPPVSDTEFAKLVTLPALRLTVPPVTLHALLFRIEKSLAAAVLTVPPANRTVAPVPVTAALPLKVWVPPPNFRVLPLATLRVLPAL